MGKKVSLYFKHGETTPDQIVHRFQHVAPVVEVSIEVLAFLLTTDLADSEGVLEWDAETNSFNVRELNDGL